MLYMHQAIKTIVIILVFNVMYPTVIRMSQIQFREQKQSETLKGKTDSKLA